MDKLDTSECLKSAEENKLINDLQNLNIGNDTHTINLDDAIAREQIDEVLEFIPTEPSEKKKISDFIKKFDRENAFPHNDPEIIKHIKFIKWMKSHGGHIRKTKIVVYGKDYRGLHAIKDINVRETVISIPITLAISGLNLEKKELGEKLLTNKTFDDKWQTYMFPLIYILEELKNPSCKIKEWLDITPSVVDDHPMFFNEEERQWLQASPTLGKDDNKYRATKN